MPRNWTIFYSFFFLRRYCAYICSPCSIELQINEGETHGPDDPWHSSLRFYLVPCTPSRAPPSKTPRWTLESKRSPSRATHSSAHSRIIIMDTTSRVGDPPETGTKLYQTDIILGGGEILYFRTSSIDAGMLSSSRTRDEYLIRSIIFHCRIPQFYRWTQNNHANLNVFRIYIIRFTYLRSDIIIY